MDEQRQQSPLVARRLLRWFLKEDLAEEVMGDLEEKFYLKVDQSGPFRARINYWYQVLNYLRPFAIRHVNTSKINPFFMWNHNLKLTVRGFIKHPTSFAINLIGLSTGLACALLIFLWVNSELEMDGFHAQEDHLYLVKQNLPLPGELRTIDGTPGLLAQSFREELPEVTYAASVITDEWFSGKGTLKHEEKVLRAGGWFVSEDFFDIFSWKLLSGNASALYEKKNAILISDELAEKLSATPESIIGQSLEWEQDNFTGIYEVVGVFERPPRQSTLQFEMILDYTLFFEHYADNLKRWANSNPSTYLLLKEGVSAASFNEKIDDYLLEKVKANEKPELVQYAGGLFIQPFSEGYLYNQFENGVQTGGRITYIWLFSFLALFILAIAGINFMNLSTARATVRFKEIAVKKAIGASKRLLTGQYLGEAMLLSGMALVLALGVVLLVLPQFNVLTGKALNLQPNLKLLGGILSITLLTGLFSGIYPALYLAAKEPVAILKGAVSRSGPEAFIRKGLVIFQFVVSILLIVSVLVVYYQIDFIQHKDLGLNEENLITFKREGPLNENIGTFLAELDALPGVMESSTLSYNLTGEHGQTSGLEWEGKDPENPIQFGALAVDYGLIELLDIGMQSGRTFSDEYGAEEKKIILNEAAMQAMGLKDPLGKMVKLWGQEMEVIGISDNFHLESLYNPVKPCFFYYFPNRRNVLIRLSPGKEQATIEQIAGLYETFTQGLTFEYHFIDDDFRELYAPEYRLSVLSRYFSGIAIVLSSLGLLGLAAFSVRKRRKEISIRKVLGASVLNILSMLTAGFTKLVLLAILIAVPLSYWVAEQWLGSFAYRIELQWWFFALAGLGALLLVWTTVVLYSHKSASVNPALHLKE